MNLLFALIALDVALGVLATIAVYRWLPSGSGRTLAASAVLAVFFSLSVIVARIIVLPLPTFVVVVMLVVDWYRTLSVPCVMHPSEGCIPPRGDGTSTWVLAPFLVQWLIWFIVANAIETARWARRRKRQLLDES